MAELSVIRHTLARLLTIKAVLAGGTGALLAVPACPPSKTAAGAGHRVAARSVLAGAVVAASRAKHTF